MVDHFDWSFPMASSDFSIGQEASNSQITATFGGSPFRAMRVSLEKKTIVLLANYASPHYVNRWEGNVLHFSAFESGPNYEQSLEYVPNRRLSEAKESGFQVVLFERYPKRKNYVYRGKVEVRGLEERQIPTNSHTGARKKLSFLLHPIRHRIAGNDPAILDVQISINNEEDYWTSYLLSQLPDLNPERRDGTNANVISSFWRAYASEVMDSFLADVESRSSGVFVAEYDLERGSIKGVFTVVAAMAGMTASTIGGVANYPKAKESWPIVKHDAEVAIKAAAEALEKKFPGVTIILKSRARNAPLRAPIDPTVGPPLVRRGEDVVNEKRSTNARKQPGANGRT
jgi:hypothetical protein